LAKNLNLFQQIRKHKKKARERFAVHAHVDVFLSGQHYKKHLRASDINLFLNARIENARLWKLEPWENAVNAINSYIYGFLCYTLKL
jgi:hypothetical protein